MEWQTWSGHKWGPSLPHFVFGRLYLLWQKQYVFYVKLFTAMVANHTSIYDQNSKRLEAIFYLPQAVFSNIPKCPTSQPSAFLPNQSKARPWLTPLSTTHCPTPTSLLWNKMNCNQMRTSIYTKWALSQENKETVLERCHPAWRWQEFTSWEPTDCKLSLDFCSEMHIYVPWGSESYADKQRWWCTWKPQE